MKKNIVCDTSSLISLADNCLLKHLAKINANFLVPQGVRSELVENPLHTHRFKLRALEMNHYFENGLIREVKNDKIFPEAQRLAGLANTLFYYKDQPVRIIQEGEAESLALLRLTNEKTLLIDERTTRHLIEDVDKLQKFIQGRTGLQLEVNTKARKQLQNDLLGINVMRSSEIIAFLYEQHLTEHHAPEKAFLEAGLYAVKFSGCSITDDEIKQYIEMLG